MLQQVILAVDGLHDLVMAVPDAHGDNPGKALQSKTLLAPC